MYDTRVAGAPTLPPETCTTIIKSGASSLSRLDPATRGWAASAIVLGITYWLFLHYVVGLAFIAGGDRVAGLSAGARLLVIVDAAAYLILPFGFVFAGVQVLRRSAAARSILASLAGFAVFVAVGGLIASRICVNTTAAITPGSDHVAIVFSMIVKALWTLIEVSYCALLYRQMTSPAARMSTR